jgi:hypothetical protein
MLVAYFVSATSTGMLAYKFGALQFADPYPASRAISDFDSAANYQSSVTNLQYNPWSHLLIGAGVMGGLALARYRWVRWPLYPIGWLLSTTWGMHAIWTSVFLGWLAKATILKFGGAELYNHLKPFFIGLIVGEIIVAGSLAAVVLIFNLQLPFQIMPT